MRHVLKRNGLFASALPEPGLPSLRSRVFGMALLWLLLGAVVA